MDTEERRTKKQYQTSWWIGNLSMFIFVCGQLFYSSPWLRIPMEALTVALLLAGVSMSHAVYPEGLPPLQSYTYPWYVELLVDVSVIVGMLHTDNRVCAGLYIAQTVVWISFRWNHHKALQPNSHASMQPAKLSNKHVSELRALSILLRKTEGPVTLSAKKIAVADAIDAIFSQPVWHPAETPEPLVRYCPECGSIGPVPPTKRDCCPDGGHARMVPENFARSCRATFLQSISKQVE